MPPILSTSNAPCIFIGDMIPGSTVKIAYFRLLHGGMRNEEYNGLNNITNDDTTILGNGVEQTDNEKSNVNMNNSYAHLKGGHNIFSNTNNLNQVDLNYNIDINVMEGIQCDNRGVVSAISIFNSTVMIINTQISLAFLTTETTKIIPGIYAEKCTLFLQSVLIKGNMEFPTCGIVAFDSSIKVSNSGFVKHKSGGILSAINFNNQIFINKTIFTDNIGCGLLITNKSKSEGYKPYLTLISSKNKMDNENIKNNIYDPKTLTVLTESEYLHGAKKKAVFEKCGEVNLDSNLFNKNNGCGARIDNCLNLNVFKNKFTDNEFNGAEITDCEGLILLNEFVKNGENGLEIKTGARKSEIVISKNTLCENVCNGIIIKGKNNNCYIQNNEKITNNMKAGIGIYEFSFPVIKNNKISNNLFQGILVGHDSSADIEENKIFENLKANIAFGGDGAEKVKIVNNEIYRSRSEGIFGLEGLGGIIAKNRIFENNDGICIFGMKDVEISENDIYRNVRSGVLVAAESTPKMIQNQIFENKFIGCMFRDKSRGEYKFNIIEKNPTQCYYTNSCKDLIDDHNKYNTITGRIDTKTCVIF
jgi:parallel beta-helix repeat protein